MGKIIEDVERSMDKKNKWREFVWERVKQGKLPIVMIKFNPHRLMFRPLSFSFGVGVNSYSTGKRITVGHYGADSVKMLDEKATALVLHNNDKIKKLSAEIYCLQKATDKYLSRRWKDFFLVLPGEVEKALNDERAAVETKGLSWWKKDEGDGA